MRKIFLMDSEKSKQKLMPRSAPMHENKLIFHLLEVVDKSITN